MELLLRLFRTSQFIGGINQYFNLDLGYKSIFLTVSAIGIIGTLSALTGISKVIKYLADFDMTFSIATTLVLLLVFLILMTIFIILLQLFIFI